MSASTLTQKNQAAIRYEEKTAYSLFLPRPFLARYPWVGFLIFLVFGAAFLVLVWQVKTGGPLTQWDVPYGTAIINWANQQSQVVILWNRFWSFYGRDGEALIALILTVGLVKKKARRELWMLWFGMMAGELWFQTLSNVIGRHRPTYPNALEHLSGPGFPSGHSVTTVLLAWMILYLLVPHIYSAARRAALIIVVVLISIIIILSRLFLGLHYITDVVAGVFLGLAWGGLVYTLIDLYFWRKNPVKIPESQGG